MNLPLARFISFVVNPLIVIVLVPFFLLHKTTGDVFTAINWTLYTLLFLLAIGVFILYMVRIGKFTDYDVSRREQRPLLFTVSVLLSVIYIAGLFVFSAPPILFIVSFGIVFGILLLSIINNWIKASMHVATIAAFILGLALAYGGFYYLLLVLIPVAGYIRVRAKRHTIPETIAGAILGLSLSLIMSVVVASVLD